MDTAVAYMCGLSTGLVPVGAHTLWWGWLLGGYSHLSFLVLNLLYRDCHLTEPGYKRLVGSTGTSWGWCLKTMKVYHDSRKFRHGVPYPRDIDEKLRVPDTFYMVLDMDRGTLAFQVKPFCSDILD